MSADPRTQFDLVHSFWQQLVALDQRVLERARRKAARRRMRRTLVFVVLLLLAAAALAAALGLLNRGEDIKPTNPASRVLALARLPGTLEIVPTTAPDPDGGPPWAMRLFRTESDVCFQIGRLVDGRLAAIGVDDEFANDNRYHVLPVEPLGCGRHDPNHGFAFGSGGTFSASGLEDEDACAPAAPGHSPPPGTGECHLDRLRGVLAGAWGRHVVEITLRAEGREVTQRIADRKYGSYIFVMRGRAPQDYALLGRYDDGSVCTLVQPYEDRSPISRHCRKRVLAP